MVVVHLQREIPRRWEAVRPLREEAYKSALDASGDESFADACAMCISELAENAVKYSLEGTTPRIDAVFLPGPRMTCVVENEASPEHLAELRRILAIASDGHANDAYIRLLTATAERGGVVSQLGFGRMRAEAGASLEARIDGNRLRLRVLVPSTDWLETGPRSYTVPCGDVEQHRSARADMVAWVLKFTGNRDFAERAGLTLAEALEQEAFGGTGEVRVTITFSDDFSSVDALFEHLASEAEIESFRSLLQPLLGREVAAFDEYVARLRRAMEAPGEIDRLRLSRIVAEGNAKLGDECTGGHLRLRVSTRVAPPLVNDA